MYYYSTRGEAPPVPLEDAVLRGLAPDGGLYYPTTIPRFTLQEIAALHAARLTCTDEHAFLQHVAAQVLAKWFGDEVEADALSAIARDAQSFPIPIRSVGPFHVLELFHGPTMAFKDVAARNLAQLMSYFLQRRGERALLLVATSGDTGGAIAHGFANLPNLRVVVLYPRGRVSALQEEQLTRVAGNVFPVEVEGVFDDCQFLVKRAFIEPRLAHLNLTSANSINIARLIPQVIYYVYASLLLHPLPLEVVVPSGNFGNLTAGLFAREMGAPIAELIAATNANDAVVHYYQSGRYPQQETTPTLSTAMDVGDPSNFVRILELAGHQHTRFRQLLRAYRVSDEETAATIRHVYEQHRYLLCPHSAVAWRVAEHHANPALHPLVVATASPGKFARELEAVTGLRVDDQQERARLEHYQPRKVAIPNRWEALEALLLELG